MSAFVRRQPMRSIDVGTRPGLHGQTLISSGLADLDKLLGGGLPLGSIMLIMEDEISQQHCSFLRYFIAEGVACKQSVCWMLPSPLSGGPASFLPDLANSSSSSSTRGPVPDSTATMSEAAGSHPTAATSTFSSQGPELRIAWQYRKYIQTQERLAEQKEQQGGPRPSSFKPAASGTKAVEAGISREWCHSFDLTKPMSQELLDSALLEVCYCSSSSSTSGEGGSAAGPQAGQQQQPQQHSHSKPGPCQAIQELRKAAAGFVDKCKQQGTGGIPVPVRDPSGIGRLAIQSLGSLAWGLPAGHEASSSGDSSCAEGAMLQALAELRLKIQDSSCSALVTSPCGMYSPSFRARLEHICDVVVSLETLADDSDVYALLPDAPSACALLHVRRLHHGALWRQRRVDDTLYVVRHKRRTIRLSAVEIDPDAEHQQQQQQKVAAEGGWPQHKPAAAQLCGGPPGDTKRVLDF